MIQAGLLSIVNTIPILCFFNQASDDLYLFNPEHLGSNLEIQRSNTSDLTSVTRSGHFWTLSNFLKPLATISFPKSPNILSNFCKGVKIYHFCSEIIFRQLLQTFGDFFLVTLDLTEGTCLLQQRQDSNLVHLTID